LTFKSHLKRSVMPELIS